MRLRIAFAAAQSMGLFLASEAFSPATWKSPQARTSISLRVASLEDDDDFLESLAGKNPAAGSDDVPSGDLEGAELSGQMKEKLKADDDTFGGGSRFKAMMEKAQSRVSDMPAPASLKNPFADNPFAGIEGLDPEETPAPAPQVSFDNMTVEQQAQMFRAMMQGQQVTPPPVTRQKADRKVGRNRDADAIQNTADVYFAQLKRDSTVRGIARLRGDDETANAVFEDEKIEELKHLISKNPHLA